MKMLIHTTARCAIHAGTVMVRMATHAYASHLAHSAMNMPRNLAKERVGTMISTSTSASKPLGEDIRDALIDYIEDLAILYSGSTDDTYSRKVARIRLLMERLG